VALIVFNKLDRASKTPGSKEVNFFYDFHNSCRQPAYKQRLQIPLLQRLPNTSNPLIRKRKKEIKRPKSPKRPRLILSSAWDPVNFPVPLKPVTEIHTEYSLKGKEQIVWPHKEAQQKVPLPIGFLVPGIFVQIYR